MSATIHFYIRSERPHADSSAQVFMLFIINSKLKAKISLHKRIPIRNEFKKLKPYEIAKLESSIRNDMFCWDSGKERATSQTPSYDKINQFIDAEKKRTNDIILKYQLSPNETHQDMAEFKRRLTAIARPDFITEIDNIIQEWVTSVRMYYCYTLAMLFKTCGKTKISFAPADDIENEISAATVN